MRLLAGISHVAHGNHNRAGTVMSSLLSDRRYVWLGPKSNANGRAHDWTVRSEGVW
jgi:hypothetical protein